MESNIENDVKQYIREELFKLQDIEYRKFHASLIPNINPEIIIGVRTSLLRKFSKEVFKNLEYKKFLDSLPHKYYEENNLHGFLIEHISNYDETIYRLEKFFPYIDNWATCDSISPKIFKKYPKELFLKIKEWIGSNYTYAVRFAIKMLMTFYLDNNFSEEHLEMVSKIKSDDYYIKMMIAWYFATALAKQYETTIQYIEKKTLDLWVHNKTIQKAIESYRIDSKTKEYLKTLKEKH